jgi:pantoate--beta-alanine ligase
MAASIHDVAEMQRETERLRRAGKRIAVVPTMGYLHSGHLELIRTARKHADTVITTIYVNPTQFGPSEDFARYPRDLARDTRLATEAGTDFIFAPATDAMYPVNYATYVMVESLSEVLEGKARPGHFRGVATVVAKLFNITKPHVAVFGQKDAQQVVIVKRMIRDLNFDIELVVVSIVREPDGLAMSSRNTYLTPDQRRSAPVLYQSLQLARRMLEEGVRDGEKIIGEMRTLITTQSSGQVDYISIAHGETLQEMTRCNEGVPLLVSLAVRFGSTRLIDNITVTL